MIPPFAFPDGQIIDARDAAAHVTLFIKFPVLISIRAKPVPRIIMPFIGESDGNAISLERPKFLNEAIVQFPVPFSSQKLHDSFTARQELGTIAPGAIHRVSQGDPLRLACIPGIFGQPDFLGGGLRIKRWQWRSGSFHRHFVILRRYHCRLIRPCAASGTGAQAAWYPPWRNKCLRQIARQLHAAASMTA